jgi:predicted Zn-dependent protease
METGRFYDGKQTRHREVRLAFAVLDLRIFDEAGLPLATWIWVDVIVVNPPGGGLRAVLSHKAEPDCRLVVSDHAWASFVAPHLPRQDLLPGAPVVTLLCLASVLFIGLMMYISPQVMDVAARFVPASWEDNLGTLAAAQFVDGKACNTSPTATRALQRLAKALDEQNRDFQVTVVNRSEINAFSLPGRHIILFRGLINRAANPELLAGVIAHEVGHSHYRHPLRMTLQNAGSKLLLSMAFGDTAMISTTMNAAGTLLMYKGSREFELQADAYAVPALLRLGIDPSNLMQFLDYMAKQMPEMDKIPAWMSNHPITSERIADLKKQIAALKQKTPDGDAPVSDAEWKAIKNACHGDKE